VQGSVIFWFKELFGEGRGKAGRSYRSRSIDIAQEDKL
jgi:hypothetical protein